MSRDLPYLTFEQTVELLSDALPARALQFEVSRISEESRQRLERAGVSDGSIAALLDTEGIPRYQIARQAVRDAGASEETVGDIFSMVDYSMRDEDNPMIGYVRSLIDDVLNPL